MKNKTKFILYPAVGVGLAIFVPTFVPDNKSVSASLDQFAQCLTDSGVVMYGAEWCSHCKNEKNAFGDSFRLINYVECPGDPKLCVEKDIKGYPAWIFPNGKKLEGEQGLERLSRESGCSLLELKQ